MNTTQSFSEWCEAVEYELGQELPNADGSNEAGPTLHELVGWHERGRSPRSAALTIRIFHGGVDNPDDGV